MGSRGGDLSRAATLVNIPIWAFHNLNDQERPPEEVKAMVAAVNAAGGNAHLTLLEGKWRESSEAWSEWWWSHDCWSEAFRDYHINAWMLAQNRSAWICWSPPGGGRPWQWWHVPTALASLLAIGWLGWRWRRRRRNRLLVAQPPSAVQMADTAEGGCATSPNPSSPSEANHEH
jgi:hypothetical protein